MEGKRVFYVALAFILVTIFSFGCASTVNERGKEFSYHTDVKIVPNQSTKKNILDAYGEPTSEGIAGKYQLLRYYYSRESLKHGRAIVQGLLSAATGGLSDLAVDHGVKNRDMKVEFKEILAYIDIQTGIVKDYYYHDSDLTGHDESESCYLKANSMFSQGGKTAEAMQMLEKAVSLNPKNRRALNDLAWKLIDDNIDIDRGILLAKTAVEVFPDSPFSNGTLGVGYFKKGDLANAEKCLQTAVELYPIYAPKNLKSLQHDQAMLEAVRKQKKI